MPNPPEPFRTVVADAAWPYGDQLPGKGRGAAKNYKSMAVDRIARYLGSDRMCDELSKHGMLGFADDFIAKDARLFLWRVAPMQEEALHVMRAWGFGAPVSELVWAKTTVDDEEIYERLLKFHRRSLDSIVQPDDLDNLVHRVRSLKPGMGRTFRMAHETCLVGRRGRPERLDRGVNSVFFAPVGKHSQKPEEFFEIVERLSPPPYLELFSGGHTRPGWTCLGADHRIERDGERVEQAAASDPAI